MFTHKLPNDGPEITYYAAIDELPSERYVAFQKRLILAEEVGSDLPAIAERLSRWGERAAAGRIEECHEEAGHLYGAVALLLNGEHQDALAFAALVSRVGDVPADDLSYEGLRATAKRISDAGLSVGQIAELLTGVKKKLRTELKQAFPARFDDVDDLRFAAAFKAALLAEAALLTADNEANRTALMSARSALYDLQPVKYLRPDHSDNPIEALVQWFESVCAALEGHGVAAPHRLPIARFYHRIGFLEKQHALA